MSDPLAPAVPPGDAAIPAATDTAGSGAPASASDSIAALGPAFGDLLARGGPVIWALAALSVAALAIALWKLWRLARAGAWRRARAERAIAAWAAGDAAAARVALRGARGYLARLAGAAIEALAEHGFDEERAREETARVARALLAEAAAGLRALELIAMIAPLLGLLGTVLGMIEAFQALEAAGARADAATLAGGIWEALLTTAAGMAVAIPAWAALTWFDSVVERLRHDMEDMASRIFTRAPSAADLLRQAAE